MENLVKEGVLRMLSIEKNKFEQKLASTRASIMEGLQGKNGRKTKNNKASCCAAISINNKRRISTLEKVLSKLDLATQRTLTGTYGICIDCRGQIPLGRLQQIPFAERCVPCKRKLEIKHPLPIDERSGFYYKPACS